MRIIIGTVIYLLSAVTLSAQKYTTAAGIRLGSGIGVSVQQSLYGNKTLEGIIQKGFFSDGTTLTALFEQHNNIFSRGMNFYLGAGPQIGIYKNGSSKNENTSNSVGAAFIGGMEFKLGKVLLSFDYKPAINLTGGHGFFDSQSAISVRYIFLKARTQTPGWMFWKKKKTNTTKEK